MRVLAFSRQRLDRVSAGAVHIVHTCAALARAGAKVVLHADLGGRTMDQVLAHHGAEPSPNLTLREMGWRWKGATFGPVANSLVKKEGAGPTIVLLTEIRPHALAIARAARRRGCRVVYEASGLAGRIAYARAGARWPESPVGTVAQSGMRASAIEIERDSRGPAHDRSGSTRDDHGSKGAHGQRHEHAHQHDHGHEHDQGHQHEHGRRHDHGTEHPGEEHESDGVHGHRHDDSGAHRHDHGEQGAHAHGGGSGPGPVLTIARSRPTAAASPSQTSGVSPATAAGAGAAGSATRPAPPAEDPEEAAGRERARFKPDPKAVAAAGEVAALEKAILDLVDVLIAPQQATIEAARPMLRAGAAAHVVPNGTILPAPASGTVKDIDILYLGSLQPWKGVDALVGAMPRLFPYSLTIVGGEDDADRKLLQQMALQIGAASRVRFLPSVPHSSVWGLYARAKVGVAPLSGAFLEAREYAFPLTLLELMAAGVPVVTTKVPSIQAIVRDGIEVLMADSDDPDDYGIYIRRLLEDGALASHLAANARKKVEELTYRKRAARLLNILGGPNA